MCTIDVTKLNSFTNIAAWSKIILMKFQRHALNNFRDIMLEARLSIHPRIIIKDLQPSHFLFLFCVFNGYLNHYIAHSAGTKAWWLNLALLTRSSD